ncbi:hypothetical protein DNTS_026975 [Danionella cerebrum]|uniref:Crumbs cell polarity complex component 2b n=1 Tax=Danionella cerebrum TaxID=2873325 RepID=A0A553N555_9TELE|nr:hypothetical protein DNTS_026975 [Danionella translucida]
MFCSVSSEVCVSSPCQNNSTCVPTLDGYYCACAPTPPIFTGHHCEHLLNPCLVAGCQFGCVGNLGTQDYICQCPEGFHGPNCTQNINECQSNPCQGRKNFCVDGANGYECHCPVGYAGDECRIKVRDCSEEPCFNNATCMWAPEGYECHCTPGFQGEHCEEDVDECVSQPCRNGALCVDGIGAYQCYCVPGFQGYHCDIEIDECASQPCENNATSSPCQNGATCHDHVGLYTCQCVPGYEGINCELDINECESAPCRHGGICRDLVNGFECDCSGSGFSGSVCELDILECLSGPCHHGASCQDGVNRYSCLCWPGYEGVNCERDVNECEAQPCENGAECFQRSDANLYRLLPQLDTEFSYERAAGYLCQCPPGFTGENCSVNIDECKSAPCENGGTCEDLINAFQCSCPPGFTGDLNECESSPCLHGGHCEDLINGFVCHCPSTSEPGALPWGGETCSVSLTGCVQNPCQNNATCLPWLHEQEHRLSCLCPAGFHGEHCETPTTFSLLPGQYLTVEIQKSNRRRRETELHGPNVKLRFRSTLPDAVIFYRGSGEQFLTLELIGGKLHSRAESGDLKLSGELEGDFSDGFWHEVTVSVDERLLLSSEGQTSEVDGGTNNHLISWVPTAGLEKIYFGGAPVEFLNKTQTITSFLGCFEDLEVDFIPVLPQSFGQEQGVEMGCERTEWCQPTPCSERGTCVDLWVNYTCQCHRPYFGHNCNEEHTSWTFSHERSRSFATFPIMQTHGRNVTVSFWLKSRHPNGLVFQLQRENQPYLTLYLNNGSLYFQIYNAFKRVSGFISNGDRVFVTIQKEQRVLLFNETQRIPLVFSDFEVEAGDVAYLGGLSEGENTAPWGGYFKGCLQDVRIDDTQLYMYSGSISQKPQHANYLPRNSSNVIEGCVGDQTCKMQPCQNGGECQVLWNDFLCTCEFGFSGKRCETRLWCVHQPCEPGTTCVDLLDGYEFGQCHVRKQHSEVQRQWLIVRHVSLVLRTREENATLLRSSSHLRFFCIGVLKSFIIVKYRPANTLEIIAFTSDVMVSDGEWHRVELYASSSLSQWLLSVDGRVSGFSRSLPGTVEYLNTSVIMLAENFTGCLGEVRIGGVYLPFFEPLVENAPQTSQFFQIGALAPPRLGCSGSPLCLSEPCLNNGTCLDQFNSFRCECSPGWTGVECQENIDECSMMPCVHGVCRDLAGDYECQCPVGYRGKNCQEEVDECWEHQCRNGGSCVPSLNRYKCVCLENFTGPFCQWRFPPRECAVDLECENGGVCFEGWWGANCTCRPGFTGYRCELDVDECKSEPCLNGGLCLNSINHYVCECLPQFSGENCQNPKHLQQEGWPWLLLLSIPLASLSLLLASIAILCLLLSARRKRRSQGTYSPSRQEHTGARMEMGSVLKLPPEERLI